MCFLPKNAAKTFIGPSIRMLPRPPAGLKSRNKSERTRRKVKKKGLGRARGRKEKGSEVGERTPIAKSCVR